MFILRSIFTSGTPRITRPGGSIEKHLHDFLRDRALQTPGLYFHEIGIEDMCTWS